MAHETVRVDGEGRLAQALSAIVLGDHVSVYLAFMYGIDPNPVDVIDHIKARLAERTARPEAPSRTAPGQSLGGLGGALL